MRTIERKDELGEVFTPPELVNEILDHFPPDVWTTYDFWLDPTCGNGNFLVKVKSRLLQNFSRKETLEQIYGADIMEDNCRETIARLYDIDDSDIQPLNLTSIIEDHFSYYDLPAITNSLFAPKTVSPDSKRLQEHNTALDHMQCQTPPIDDGKRRTLGAYLRPGLIAVFISKKTIPGIIKKGEIFPTIVQADGLVYDYSFGHEELSDTELNRIRVENKPRILKTCPLTGAKNVSKVKPIGPYTVIDTKKIIYKIENCVVDMLQKDKNLFTSDFKEGWIEKIKNSNDILQISKSDLEDSYTE